MKQGLFVFAVLLALSANGAMAQTSEITTTQSSTAAPMTAPAPVPPGTVATSRETHAVDAYGNRTDTTASSYSAADGARETQTTTTQVPVAPPPPVTTSTTTTRTTTTAVPN